MTTRIARLLLCLPVMAALTALTAPAAQAAEPPVKIYVMVGQSNMQGKGIIDGLTTRGTLEYIAANEPATYGFLKDGSGEWVVRDDVWMYYERSKLDLKTGNFTVGYGSANSMCGPEIGFGHAVGDANGQQVLLIKTAWGGKSLGNDFLPPSSGPYPAPENPGDAGYYYAQILHLVDDAINNLSTYFPDYAGQGYEIAGLCFHQGWNDQYGGLEASYETNLANFINDIRSAENGLGVPNLPFVIATSGNIRTEHVIKDAQLAMANTTKYPDFAGNVAVVNTDGVYTPLSLVFWQDAANSPADEAYHWNKNARTYTNIGLAMANEMSLLSGAVCPSRLRATGTASGVVLNWQNGSETPTSVKILRDGDEIIAALAGTNTTYTDTTSLPGIHDYELVFTMPTTACDPLAVQHDSGISVPIAYRVATGVQLEWKNNLNYSGIQITRNGSVIASSITGADTAYTDTNAPSSGLLTYSLVPTTGTSTAAEVQINLGPQDAGGALVYEPFDYPANDGLVGNSGATGTSGPWYQAATSTREAEVIPIGLSYGALPVTGNGIRPAQYAPNHLINFGTTLSDAGLLADGATLWFSMLYKPTSSVNSGISIYFGDGEASLTGVGVKIGGTTTNYSVMTNGTATNNLSANSGLVMLETRLIVGQLIWGVDGADDQYYIYFPDSKLNMGSASRSAAPFNVDQSTFDSLIFSFYNIAGDVDEIRFGASYQAVIGGEVDTSDDFTPPSPNPMTWASAPAADSETAISMTATTATDLNGVEYRFLETSGKPGGTSSNWQLSPSYTDTGLNPDTTYSYTVQARDRSVNYNTNTESSPVANATTFPVDVTAPPTPSFVTPLGPVTSVTIDLKANPVTDPEGKNVEYRFTNVTNGTNSGWLSSPAYTASGLSPESTYSFTVEARDTASVPNTSAPSAQESATTLSANPALTDNLPIAMHTTYPMAISVTPGEEGFASITGGGAIDTSFNNPVLDYKFFQAGGTAYASGASGSGGVSRISNLTNASTGHNNTNLWETSSTTGPADFTSKGVRSITETGVGDGTTFTVDISGLGSGSVYVINGSWQAATDWLSVSMTGSGQTTVNTDSGDGDGDENNATFGYSPAAAGVLYYAKRIDFSGAEAYDTITITVYVGGGQTGGYFSGVVLTQAPAEQDPYTNWAGGEAFGGDKNRDGISNGMAFLLGAPTPDADAADRMPVAVADAGGFSLAFTCLKGAGRGGRTLHLEYSGDLGQTDPWSAHRAEIPGNASIVTVNDIDFEISENSGDASMIDVIATIPHGKAIAGKIFARLSASE